MYKIMIWNAQHFDNQAGDPSVAYREKKEFLEYYISQTKPHLIALFETGKTGDVNERLINDMSGEYVQVAALGQEGGQKKHTTLGSLIFVKKEIADRFDDVSGKYIMSGEQRAPLIIRHKKSTYGFAFYHANASVMAGGNISDTIRFINDNRSNLEIKKLMFFGGDLNVHASEGAGEFGELKKLVPMGSGYTHVSIRNITQQQAALELADQKTLGQYTRHDVKDYLPEYMYNHCLSKCELSPIVHLYDYAYVLQPECWKATCHGYYQTEAEDDVIVGVTRGCFGKFIRSDHFPVLFEMVASID